MGRRGREDRDTSTNDTYLVLANGASGVTIEKGTEAYDDFKAALYLVAEDLAKQMAADGEGCTKLLEVRVIHSNLVKAAVFGNDANW